MNNMTTCLYSITYSFPDSSEDSETTPFSEKTPLKDYGMISGTNYEDIIRQLLSETYLEEDVLEVHLYKIPHNIMFSTSENLWNQLKNELID